MEYCSLTERHISATLILANCYTLSKLQVERLEREHVHDSRRMRQMEEASMKVTCELVKFLNPTVHKSPKILVSCVGDCDITEYTTFLM